jgi:hypothetical protein
MESRHTTTRGANLTDARRLTLLQTREAWRRARDETTDAYREWCSASVNERRTAYTVYLAAADREVAAELALVRTAEAA